jgi:hypothetical protein
MPSVQTRYFVYFAVDSHDMWGMIVRKIVHRVGGCPKLDAVCLKTCSGAMRCGMTAGAGFEE